MNWKQYMTKTYVKDILVLFLGNAILAFGLYHIHAQSNVTEGGVLGLTLLLYRWFDISPAFSGLILNAACFYLGFRTLGKRFIVYSCISGGSYSVFYFIFEQFAPIWPDISNHPFIAAVAGAMFVGVGVGICVRVGGAPGGDDALAMSLAKLTKKDIQWIYLFSDLIVLCLSLTYIPVRRIAYSLLTVILSGQIVGWVSKGTEKEENA